MTTPTVHESQIVAQGCLPTIDPDVADYSVIPASVVRAQGRLWMVDAPDHRRVGVVVQACGTILAVVNGSVSPDRCESVREAVALLVSVDSMVHPSA